MFLKQQVEHEDTFQFADRSNSRKNIFNPKMDLIDEIHAMNNNNQHEQAGDTSKFGLTTKLLNSNSLIASAKSPFLLSLTNKMQLLEAAPVA